MEKRLASLHRQLWAEKIVAEQIGEETLTLFLAAALHKLGCAVEECARVSPDLYACPDLSA
jgi:hypothetical protein